MLTSSGLSTRLSSHIKIQERPSLTTQPSKSLDISFSIVSTLSTLLFSSLSKFTLIFLLGCFATYPTARIEVPRTAGI
jgi:hypothetical protein